VQSAPPAPAPSDTLTLVLVLYKNYTRDGQAYKQGVQYKFMREDAMVLLDEQDAGRPVWRIYRVPVVRKTESTHVDATNRQVRPVIEGDPVVAAASAAKRIEVGSEDEIADILNQPDDVQI